MNYQADDMTQGLSLKFAAGFHIRLETKSARKMRDAALSVVILW